MSNSFKYFLLSFKKVQKIRQVQFFFGRKVFTNYGKQDRWFQPGGIPFVNQHIPSKVFVCRSQSGSSSQGFFNTFLKDNREIKEKVILYPSLGLKVYVIWLKRLRDEEDYIGDRGDHSETLNLIV